MGREQSAADEQLQVGYIAAASRQVQPHRTVLAVFPRLGAQHPPS